MLVAIRYQYKIQFIKVRKRLKVKHFIIFLWDFFYSIVSKILLSYALSHYVIFNFFLSCAIIHYTNIYGSTSQKLICRLEKKSFVYFEPVFDILNNRRYSDRKSMSRFLYSEFLIDSDTPVSYLFVFFLLRGRFSIWSLTEIVIQRETTPICPTSKVKLRVYSERH